MAGCRVVSPDDDDVAEPEEQPTPAMAPAVRWLARLAVVAVALKFIVQGFEGHWSGADELATAFLVVAVVLGVIAAGYALVERTRRTL
jgi:hypothetical protein